MRTITLTIQGKPITKLRPRFSRFKGHVRTYDSQSEEKETIKWQLKSRMKGTDLFVLPLEVSLKFFMPIPKSTSKKKKEMMITGKIKHIKTPDCDNLYKMYTDCMNGIVYLDDKQIYKMTAIKQYSDNPRTEVTVWQESKQDKSMESGQL